MSRYESAAIRTYTSLGVLNTGQAVIFTIGMVICMLLAARDVTQGTLTVGEFVMINAILIQLYRAAEFHGHGLSRDQAGADRRRDHVRAAATSRRRSSTGKSAKPLRVGKGEIEFENVSFAYEPERPILKDVSFAVPAGKMVAIVGPSGAGKSTISRILFRFYEHRRGRVTIDGQDIRDVTQDSLRAAIGMVPQDTVLFNDTIEYNIRYGKPDATRGRGARGGAARADPRLHHDAAAGLRFAGRRAGPEAFRRREAARGHRPHHSQRRRRS